MAMMVSALCHFCESHGPRVVMVCQGLEEENDVCREEKRTEEEEKVERCLACSIVGVEDEGRELSWHDPVSGVIYRSSQMAIHRSVAIRVEQSCLRSLSCEVASSSDDAQDGAVMFGDEGSGFTLSLTFRVRDAKARGFHRRFSLILLTGDKIHLVHNYHFFLRSLNDIVQGIQDMATNVFQREQSIDPCALRESVVARAAMLPSGFLRTRAASIDPSRSLSLLTGSSDFFIDLHRQMAEMLSTQLCEERIMEGEPSQDSLIVSESDTHDCLSSFASSSDDRFSSFASPSGDRLLSFASPSELLKGLCSRLLSLPCSTIQSILQQLVIGGQIVVQSSQLSISTQFLLALSVLLPLGCVRYASSTTYLPSYRCNLLALCSNAQVPNDGEEFLHLRLYDGDEDGDDEGDVEGKGRIQCSIEHFPTGLDSTLPSIVKRYMKLLLDDILPISFLESAIRCVREQWLGQAKMFYQMSRRGIDPLKVASAINCSHEDIKVLCFWQAGLSKVYKQQILKSINRGPCDR